MIVVIVILEQCVVITQLTSFHEDGGLLVVLLLSHLCHEHVSPVERLPDAEHLDQGRVVPLHLPHELVDCAQAVVMVPVHLGVDVATVDQIVICGEKENMDGFRWAETGAWKTM